MKSIGFKVLMAASIMATAASAPAAAATLIGDTVDVEYRYTYNTVRGSDTVVVGAGAEISCPGASTLCSGYTTSNLQVSIDIDADTIAFDVIYPFDPINYGSGDFNGYVFKDLNFGTGITGAEIVSSYGFTGLDLSRISFTADSVSINMQALPIEAEHGWTIRLLSDDVSEVPLPAALPLFIAGVAGVSAASRKRRKKSA